MPSTREMLVRAKRIFNGWNIPAKARAITSRPRNVLRFSAAWLLDAIPGLWTWVGSGWRTLSVWGRIFVSFVLVTVMAVTADLLSLSDRVCSDPGWFAACRFANVGNVPSEAEEREWAQVVTGSDCDEFERIYGRRGFYSDAAKVRLDLMQNPPVPKKLSIPRTVPVTSPAQPTELDAIRLLNRSASNDAKQFCSTHAQSFSGQIGHGQFVVIGSPQCDQYEDGFVCSATGEVRCTFMKKGEVQICPLPE
jgi:hypothetical protein